MADEDLTIKARIDDELSRPLEGIRDEVRAVGREAEDSGRRASRSSRGWDLYGRAAQKAGKLAHTAGRLAKGALLGIGAGLAAATYAAGRLAMSSIRQASDLNESLNAVNVTYGKQAKAVKQLGREAAKSLGLSNVEFNGMAVQFSSFAEAIGGGGKGTVKVLDNITTRAADFASVMNIDVAEATALFQSGLAGESEPLRRYGINLSAAAVTSYALSKGIIEGKESLTDAQKVTATYGLLMEKTADTQGDFSNTSDQLANQQRILGARFDNAQAKLGKGLLPIMQTGVKFLNREGIPAFLDFSDWFTNKGLPAIGRFAEKGRQLGETYLPKVKTALNDVRDVAAKGAAAGKKLVDAFLGMPSWARKVLVGGGATAAIAAKLGVPKLLKGATGLAGLASKAKPLPVFVTNPGFGGGTGAGGAAGKPGFLTRAGEGLKTTGPLAALGSLGLGLGIAGAPVAALSSYGLNESGKLSDAEGNRRTAVGSAYGGVWTQTEMSSAKELGDVGKKAAEVYAGALDSARMSAAGFSAELDLVGSKKVKPEVRGDSIKAANDALSKFIGYQIDAGRPIAPYVTINGYAQAMQQIATLTNAVHSIPTAGTDNGVPFVGGRGGTGGGGGGGGESEKLERRAPRTTGSGGVTVMPNGIVVHNPSSNVDIVRAIEQYERDRQERN